VNLHGVQRRLQAGLAEVELGEGGLAGGGQALLLRPRGPVEQQAAGLQGIADSFGK